MCCRGTGSAWHGYDVHSAFDAKNRRVCKSFTDTTAPKTATWFFYYDSRDRLTEIEYTPDTSASTTHSTFELLRLQDRLSMYWQSDWISGSLTTSRRYVGTDETGRAIDMWNWPNSGNSTRVWAINPRAWGQDTTVTGPSVFQPTLFAGQYTDSETASYESDGVTTHRPSLALNGFRTYDPFTGAFLQSDPLLPRTRSSYVYVSSSPTQHSDRDGRGCNTIEGCDSQAESESGAGGGDDPGDGQEGGPEEGPSGPGPSGPPDPPGPVPGGDGPPGPPPPPPPSGPDPLPDSGYDGSPGTAGGDSNGGGSVSGGEGVGGFLGWWPWHRRKKPVTLSNTLDNNDPRAIAVKKQCAACKKACSTGDAVYTCRQVRYGMLECYPDPTKVAKCQKDKCLLLCPELSTSSH